MSDTIVVTPEEVPKLLSDLALRWNGTRVRDPADVTAPDGNHYTLYGDCEGCIRLRSRVRHLEDALSELQDLLADVAAVLKGAGLLAAGAGTPGGETT